MQEDSIFVKTPDGKIIEDRRASSNMETQQTILKLVAKLESMETNIDIKLESVKDKITNLEDKVFNNFAIKDAKIITLEEKLDTHCENEDDKATTIETIKSYKEKFEHILVKVKEFDSRINVLETAGIKSKAKFVDDISGTIKNVVLSAIGVAIVGFVGWLIVMYITSGAINALAK